MKRVILGLFVAGTFLVSCGGPSPAKDVEGTVKLKQDVNASLEDYYNQVLENQKEVDELNKEWEEVTKKELLEEYGGVEKGVFNLEEKVKKNEEQAISDWIAYQVAKHEHNAEIDDVNEVSDSDADDYSDKNWAFETSKELLGLIHSDDKMKADKEKLAADLKIEDDKMTEIQKKLKEAYKTWYDNEFKGKKEDFNELQLM